MKLKEKIHQNYHWIIAAVTLLMLAVYGGAANNFSSLHLIPVTEALGISRTEYALYYSLKSVMAMIVSFVSGSILKKFGFRNASLFCLGIASVGYFLLSGMKEVYIFVLVCFFMGSATAFCGTAGATRIISDWFHRYRGTILGLVASATGFGGSIMCIAQSAVMEATSWRGSFFFCGIGCSVIFLLTLLFIRNKPKDLGLEPFGEGEEITGKKKRISETAFPGMSMKQLSRAPSFYLMILCTFISCVAVYLVFNTVLPFLTDSGFSSAQAAGLQSTMMLLFTGTKILVGVCSDYFGIKKVNSVCVVFGVISILLLAMAKSFALASVAVVLYTVAIPLCTITVPLLAFSLFGYSSQPQYTGIFISAIYAASFLASPLSNFIHDKLGSYSPAYFLAALLFAISFFLYLLLYRLAKHDNEKDAKKEAE